MTDISAVRRGRPRAADGFTLIELVVVVALMGVASSLALVGLKTYGSAQDQQGTANELVSDLRNAGQRAVTEARTYCVSISEAAETWTLYRKSCSAAGTVVQGPVKARGKVTLAGLAIGTSSACPVAQSCVYFFPRGTATGGPSGQPSKIEVQQDGRTAISVTVEGLTGRVDRS